ALEDADRAETVAELLGPYSGQLVVVANGSYCPGAVDRYLGMALATAGRLEEAELCFLSALEMEGRMGALPLLARTRYWHARLLLKRGDPDDRERAAEHLRTALATATELGMPALAAQVEALGASV
ncbi:MAG: helix-turn-helix transcriptional regulator, partial [Actinobacteria bacterium]|nr:helix-turn-helix transcriptional regulator [Actinomycetota bacterium]